MNTPIRALPRLSATHRAGVSLLIAGLALGLGACATPYGDVGQAAAGGYSDRQLSEGLYEVRFRGNAFTTRARGQDLALLRAAEVAEANGCASFRVVNQSDGTRVADPEAATTAYTPDATGVFERTDVSAAPSYIHAMPKVESVTVLRIRCTAAVAGRAGTPSDLYDPQAVEREMRARYDLG